MVAELQGVQDSIDYAFWSAGNFAGAGNMNSMKYLTVDGVDPLFPNYAGGAVP